MSKLKYKYFYQFKMIFILIILGFIFLQSCENEQEKELSIVDFDLDKIKERGKLIALTGYNAYSYFIYKGAPMGYEYELVNKLAEHLGVEVEFKIVREIDKMFEMLNNGEGDLIAFNLTVTKKRFDKVAFTTYHNTTRQVLVQRRPDNWRDLTYDQIEDGMLRNPIDLIGRTVTIRRGSAYKQRLLNLSDEIGGDIKIIEAEADLTIEELIENVANGSIEYTIADENIAKLVHEYNKNLDYKTQISLDQRIAWAVRKNAGQFLSEVDSWIESMKRKTDYYVIYNKYYKIRNGFKSRVSSEFFTNKSGKISEYDEVIKSYADSIGWDWRLLASQMFQESQFNPNAKSWAGAVGLMQLMPATIEQYKVLNPIDPYENIEGGIKHIVWLDKYWKQFVEDKSERIKFVLASYNIGLGHIKDAKKLAEKYEAESLIWQDNVERFLLNKSKKRYFSDEVVLHGYCRGIEAVNYVNEILTRYGHYRQLLAVEEIGDLG
ncbi:MAG: transporter substrate-binding domain-containing protein [Melioribacteraceae bacterium]|nr:transporter substrate-binding domain-containing protein [Melioribacteraceae bacterium]